MKKKGSILEFTHKRNDELMEAYIGAMNQFGRIDVRDVAKRMVGTPCSRFWVSEERALAVISAMENGRPLPERMRKTKKAMYAEIYRRVKALRVRSPWLTLRDIVTAVIYQPAPCFYMNPRSAMEIIYRIRSGR